jgi:hypothetical protein
MKAASSERVPLTTPATKTKSASWSRRPVKWSAYELLEAGPLRLVALGHALGRAGVRRLLWVAARKEIVVKQLRFICWDLWVKIVLWVCAFPVMLFFKVIQYGVRAGNKEQREAASLQAELARQQLEALKREGERNA